MEELTVIQLNTKDFDEEKITQFLNLYIGRRVKSETVMICTILGFLGIGGIQRFITGQIGMDKKPYLEEVERLAGERGGNIDVFNVGQMMYSEGPDIREGRILDLPLSRLHSLRRAAIKDIVSETSPFCEHPNVIMNTHATFRWRHGLFPAFDFDQLIEFQPDLFICLVDNIEVVHDRLHAEQIGRAHV